MLVASIPSPHTGIVNLGPLHIHLYGLTLLVAILACVWLTASAVPVESRANCKLAVALKLTRNAPLICRPTLSGSRVLGNFEFHP